MQFLSHLFCTTDTITHRYSVGVCTKPFKAFFSKHICILLLKHFAIFLNQCIQFPYLLGHKIIILHLHHQFLTFWILDYILGINSSIPITKIGLLLHGFGEGLY